jgi:hypothetical protein
MKAQNLCVAVLLLVALGLVVPQSAVAQALTTYRVTITNLTKGQIFSPPLVVTHKGSVALFEAGLPASSELALLAEDGDASALADLASASSAVTDVVVAGGPLLPGASVDLEVEAAYPFDFVSAVGMLVTTNDGFFGLDSVRAPHRLVTEVEYVAAYDAGSEANNEDCDFIPGPPCGNPLVRDTAGAEGVVYIHSGIHDIADLEASLQDWRNPVARIIVSRAD